MRLYSTANERGLYLNRLFVCLSAKCRRDARDPLARLHFRIAGVLPACGCTQPLVIEVISQPPFFLPFGKMQAGRPRSVGLACILGSRASRLCSFRLAGGAVAFLILPNEFPRRLQ
ncbi:MAG: hypothetical protein LBP59_17500, partial [Planctomycetaceae bacterium]|nr:hypothetical protein [Planctomycetaceae bacterium]